MNEYGDTPEIFVICAASYDFLRMSYGVWIDVTTATEMQHVIDCFLEDSPAPDKRGHLIHAQRGLESIEFEEDETLHHVATTAALLTEFGDPFAEYYDKVSGDLARAAEKFGVVYSEPGERRSPLRTTAQAH